MRRSTKEQIIKLLTTVREAVEFVICKSLQAEVLQKILNDCHEGMMTVSAQYDELMDEAQSRFRTKTFEILQDITELSRGMDDSGNADYYCNKILQSLEDLEQDLKANLRCKLEILFLPYKFSMWDSMASVWEAARKDPMCNCRVMPIPYYDKDDKLNFQTFYYEGGDFPMEIVDYRTYDLELVRPDIIYFHNPYDEFNYITSVDTRFYARELVKYTNMLVYLPYYMFGEVKEHYEISSNMQQVGGKLATKIILPCENVKECFKIGGENPEKLVVLGSPKVDAVVNMKKVWEIPDRWKAKLAGRKIILINTSLTAYLREPGWLKHVENILLQLSKNKEIGIIWRPHPLMRSSMKSIRMNDIAQYSEVLNTINNSDNIVVDHDEDLMAVIGISDALISDYSSVLIQYTFTGKPALSLDHTSKDRTSIVFCDYFSQYFINDGETLDGFIDMVIQGEDKKKEERLLYARNSVVNSDGTCGAKVHQYIKEECLKADFYIQ